ncbi:MAG: hypothetical protein EXR79_10545 [Myxococcales bacterium]|nr:hypothetical protein [Myxococcales bacterium]
MPFSLPGRTQSVFVRAAVALAMIGAVATIGLLLGSAAAHAATLPVTGLLRNDAGGPVADGKYVFIVALYEAADATKPAWEETQKSVDVNKGLFAMTIGENVAIPVGLVSTDKPLWFGVQVGAEPELPRSPVQWSARAWYAHAAGAGTFAYAASTSPGGKATGLECSGCVTAAMLGNGAVQAAHVGFSYAGSESKGGPATSALHATTADSAKQAENASKADVAKLADVAKNADSAAKADELACLGCVGAKQLAPDVAASYLSVKGGTISGKVNATQGIDLAGSELAGAKLAAVDVGKATCDAGAAGRIAADGAGGLLFCTGKAWKKVKLCSGACQAATAIVCGQPVVDDCGDLSSCSGKGSACAANEECKGDKCHNTLGTSTNPAASCADMLAKNPGAADALYWIDPTGGDAADKFEVWCRMAGDYPGAALVIKRPGSVAGQENVAGALNGPCTPTSSGYCKLSDTQINAIRQTSIHVDAFVSLAYKDGGAMPYCRSFASKTCKWISDAAAGGDCSNSVKRDSGQYCARGQTTAAYRGMDGHSCGNLSYSGIANPGNPFVIFEHSGGTHYCGGWDTTWNRIELLVN